MEGDREIAVPGVSKILGAMNEGEALSAWKIKKTSDFWFNYLLSQGTAEPDSLEAIAKQAKRAHKVASEDAIDIGKEVHLALQCYLTNVSLGLQECGKPPPEWPSHPQVLNCFHQAITWLSEHKIEPLEIERVLYSRRFDYAGTADFIAKVDGVLTLLDWKTSGAIYAKYRFQTASYAQAYEEECGVKVEQRILSRLDKEGNAEPPLVLPRAEQRKDFAAFRACLTLTHRLSEIS